MTDVMDRKFYPTHQGYLIKSPPSTGLLRFLKRWRKRWFVLRDDKSLEYYTERGGRLVKTINLKICTCLEKEVNHRKFDNIFSLKINGRSDDGKRVDKIYLLSAETIYEMNTWVEEISKLCTFQNYEDKKFGPSSRQERLQSKERLNKTETKNTDKTPDSGIQVSSNENGKSNETVTAKVHHTGSLPLEINKTNKQYGVGVNNADLQTTYDVPPNDGHRVSQDNHDSYDVPSKTVARETYVVQTPNDGHRPSYDAPRNSGMQSTYDVPSSDGFSIIDDNRYDVPRLTGSQSALHVPPNDHYPTNNSYDVPRKAGAQSTYDVPPSDGHSKSYHKPSSASSQSGDTNISGIALQVDDQSNTYDVPTKSSYEYVPMNQKSNVHVVSQDNCHNDVTISSTYDTPAPKAINKYVNLEYPRR